MALLREVGLMRRLVEFRPEGPIFNNRAREGVDQEIRKVNERRRCGTNEMTDRGRMAGTVGP